MNENIPLPGEVTLKEWRLAMAEALRVSAACFKRRLYRRRYPYPKVRRVNKRVVFVRL